MSTEYEISADDRQEVDFPALVEAVTHQVLKNVAHYAAERGVSLGVEAVNRYETYLINLAEQADAMLDRVGEPNVFVHLDTYHMNIEEKGFYEPIVATGPRMHYIHLSESDRGTPGTGNVHWDEVFRSLKAIDYDGYLVMESFAAINEDLAGATALWRDVVGDPETLIRDGLGFLRGKAAEHRQPDPPPDSFIVAPRRTRHRHGRRVPVEQRGRIR